MIKGILPILIILLSSYLSYGQKTYKFLPNWQVGDHRIIESKFQTIKYDQDTISKQSIDSSSYQIKILSQTEKYYVVELQYDHVIFDDFRIRDESFDENFKKNNLIRIKYKVNKHTAEASLFDWETSNEYMKQSVQNVVEFLNKTSVGEYDSTSFSLYRKMLDTQDKVDLFVGTDLIDIIAPFNQELKLNETREFSDSCENPMNKSQMVKANCQTTLLKINEQKGVCQLSIKMIPDMTGFKKMISEMMRKFSKMTKVDKQSVDQKVKEIEEFDFHVEQLYSYELNYRNGWTQTLKKHHTVYGQDPQKGKFKTVSTVTMLLK